MPDVAGLPRSTYYYYTRKQKDPDKYAELKEEICSIVTEHKGRYGYRRVTQELQNRGFHHNHKLVMKLMKKLCALPGFVDSKNEEKTERNAGYLVVSHSGGGMLRQGTRKGIRRTPANRGMRAHRIVKSLDISEDVCHGMCP